jgi:hypothetical protein
LMKCLPSYYPQGFFETFAKEGIVKVPNEDAIVLRSRSFNC